MPVKTKKSELNDMVVRLRTVVLTLGESANPPWWSTKFMNQTGFNFLERIYPRSYFQAALNSAGKAARDAHDRSTGKIGVYHLFRLPVTLETDIHSHILSSVDILSADIKKLFTESGTPVERLKLLAGSVGQVEEATGGAQQIGDGADWRKISTYKKAASIYHNAFLNGKQAYPYLIINGDKKFENGQSNR